ncbi:hypothetical protein [Alteromonas sp. OM2203]|uniref:hypothetical protein n=1 Tax=Alteromonas sp. OM2203 TaxID=3398817 RepID=UPI003AF36533
MDKPELKFEVIPSPHDPQVGASVGVRVHYGSMNVTAESTLKRTQYANKVEAVERLKKRLVAERFLSINDTDWIDANAFANDND